jgi:protein tyrosine/serine phosphatase
MDGRHSTPAAQSPAPPTRRFVLVRALLGGGVGGLLFAAGIEFYHIAAGGNFHEVIPGVVYRSSQPSPEQLVGLVKEHGIRTVVNLRGSCDQAPWYMQESRATLQLDLSQEDLPFSAGRLPSVPVIRELVNVLDHSERPILLHCYQGIDRTGMASTMALLLYTDISLDKAMKQLGPRYGHLRLGRTGNIDRFFELYAEWLAEMGYPHTSANFRHWVEQEYCPGECLASIEILEPRADPLMMRRGEPLAVHVRCTNRSVKPWRFRPGKDAGIHAFWQIHTMEDRLVNEGRSGLFHAEVAPRQSIDLTLALPSLQQPGHYRLRIDMKDEQHALFHQLGPQSLEVELVVR